MKQPVDSCKLTFKVAADGLGLSMGTNLKSLNQKIPGPVMTRSVSNCDKHVLNMNIQLSRKIYFTRL